MKIKIITLMLLLTSVLQGQTSTTLYEYDSQGNCIKRISTIIMKKKVEKTVAAESEVQKYVDEELNLNIYPNPTKDILTIDVPDFDENAVIRFELYDLSGKKQTSITAKGAQTRLDLSSYSAGTYILLLHRNGKVTSWKIIKIN